MDVFKRSTLLTSQAALGQITSAEVQAEMKTLIPAMQADPESQPDQPGQTSEPAPQASTPGGY